MKIDLTQRLTPILNNPARPLASLAAVVFSHDEIIAQAYLGNRYIDAHDPTQNLAVNPDTKFRVASISKLVATLGIMQLVEQNKLNLDDDISYLLGFAVRNPHLLMKPITTRMLLSHTSSIRDGNEPYSLPVPYTMREFFEPDGAFFAKGIHWGKASEPPGYHFHYCNLNFGLIGTLIEICSGQRFDQYMRQHIFDPLGINASYSVRDFDDDTLNNLAVLYRKEQPGGTWVPSGSWIPQIDDYRAQRPNSIVRIENRDNGHSPDRSYRNLRSNDDVGSPTESSRALSLDDYVIGTNGTLFSPQGGLRISAVDLAKIGQLIQRGGALGSVRLLQEETIRQLLTPVWRYDPLSQNGDPYGGLMRSWGLGVQLITNYSAQREGDRLVDQMNLTYAGHAGDAYGLHSGLWFDPNGDSGYVYLIGGVGDNPKEHPGRYSSFYRWEEEISTELYQTIIEHRQENYS